MGPPTTTPHRGRSGLRALLSFVGLQVGWLACVLGAAHGRPWIGPAVVLATLVIHVRAQPPADRAREVLVLAVAAVLGLLVDTTLISAGVITAGAVTVSPVWLIALWPNVAAATARTGSLAFLDERPILASLVGAVAAPLAYQAGSRLGAIGLGNDAARALLAIGAAWSCVLPTFFWLRHFGKR